MQLAPPGPGALSVPLAPPGPGDLSVPLVLRRTNGCRAEIDVLGEAESLCTPFCSWSDCDGEECWERDSECSSCSDSGSFGRASPVFLRFTWPFSEGANDVYNAYVCKRHKYNTDIIEALFSFPFLTYQGRAGMGSFARFLLLEVSEPFLHCSHLHLSAALSYMSKLVLIEQMNIKTTNGKLSYSQFLISEISFSPGSSDYLEPCTLKCCSGHLDAQSPIAE